MHIVSTKHRTAWNVLARSLSTDHRRHSSMVYMHCFHISNGSILTFVSPSNCFKNSRAAAASLRMISRWRSLLGMNRARNGSGRMFSDSPYAKISTGISWPWIRSQRFHILCPTHKVLTLESNPGFMSNAQSNLAKVRKSPCSASGWPLHCLRPQPNAL